MKKRCTGRKKKTAIKWQPNPDRMRPELKFTVKKMIREAIRWQNKQVLFTCRECCFYQAEGCTLKPTNTLMLSKRMPTQLPECFTYDPLASAFADVLTLIYSLGVDTIHCKHGWATVAGRLAARANQYGYIMGVTSKNLERYG